MKPTALCFLFVLFIVIACDETNDAAATLKGQWKWKSTCGGFVGCVYPSQSDTRLMIIGDTQVVIFNDGDVAFSKNYSLRRLQRKHNSTIFELAFNDDLIWTCEVFADGLTIHHNSVITSEYERLSKVKGH